MTVPTVGVFVIRVWTEGPGPAGLRARLTYTTDIESREVSVRAAADADGVCEAVRAWLTEYLNASGRRPGP